jgi:hypothetical protein
MHRGKTGIILLVAVLMIGSIAMMSMASAGDSSDPLITLSYLEMRLENIETGSVETIGNGYEVFPVKADQRISFGQGAEVILRYGEASAFVSARGGLADVTAGRDIGENESILLNHLIICPINDGRGFEFSSDSWIMIKGDYSIESNN